MKVVVDVEVVYPDVALNEAYWRGFYAFPAARWRGAIGGSGSFPALSQIKCPYRMKAKCDAWSRGFHDALMAVRS